jgi:TolB protein
LALVTNGGTVVGQMAAPAGTTYCSPARWWSPGVVLASCGGRLWEIPTSGGMPTALTATPVNPDTGDLDAWFTPSGTFVQDTGACGYQYLAKLQPNSTTSPVVVPDVSSGQSQVVLGTYQGRIALEATAACASGASVLWYDPASDASTVVLGPGVNAGSVSGVLAYPDES